MFVCMCVYVCVYVCVCVCVCVCVFLYRWSTGRFYAVNSAKYCYFLGKLFVGCVVLWAQALYTNPRVIAILFLSLSALILSGAHKHKRVHVEAFLYIFNGIYQGRITDWDMMSTIWEFSFRESGVSHCMDEMIVLTTENCDTNNKDAESALSIMFEQFNVKGESCYSFSACGILLSASRFGDRERRERWTHM